jgi:Zonular occludens toxin (Zot)
VSVLVSLLAAKLASIYGYVGLPRSGKSYNVVAHVILPALREGRRVVTNVPVYRDKIFALLEKERVSNPGELVDFPITEVAQDPELIRKYVTAGSVFVLDEVWRLWPSGMKASDIPECYKSLLAEHGHMVDAQGRACHIVLVVQDLANIAVFARRLVEQTFLHTKMGHLGQEGRFRVDVYQASITGVIGPQKQRLREIYGSYTSDVWDLYKSHTLSEAKADGANEKSVDRRGNVLKSPLFMFGLPLAALAGVGAVYFLTQRVAAMTHPPQPPKGVASASHPGFVDSVQRPAGGSLLGNLPLPQPSRVNFRVVGTIEVPGDPSRSRAILQSSSGQTVSRSMTHCRYVDTDFLECEVDGQWYGTAGASLVAHVSDAIPVTLPAGQPLQMPLPAPLPVAAIGGEGAAHAWQSHSAAPPLSAALPAPAARLR